MQHYYRAQLKHGGWLFQIYTWDSSGNKMIVLHESAPTFYTKGEAEDGATDYAEDHNLDVELG